MEYITIEHKNGAITLSTDAIDYIVYRSTIDNYHVYFKQTLHFKHMMDVEKLDNVELNKEQYEKLLMNFLKEREKNDL